MRNALISLSAILIGCAFVLPAIPADAFMKFVGIDTGSDNASADQHEDNEDYHDHDAVENEDEENEPADIEHEMVDGMLLAGGGGWFAVNMSGTICKDSFGVFIDGDAGNWSYSSFVFQARDQGVAIHSRNFTNVVFDNLTVADLTYVHAWGWATYDSVEGFWFHLVLVDNGSRSADLFDLSMYKDLNKNWAMDESLPLLQWTAKGLGGGQIWLGSEEIVSEQ